MNERASRFLFGFFLIIFLFLESNIGVYAIVSILIFEGITNFRFLSLLNYIKADTHGTRPVQDENIDYKFSYEAEQLFRYFAAIFISLGSIFFNETLWILPWFVSLNLLLTGITGICPIVMFFRRLGFR